MGIDSRRLFAPTVPAFDAAAGSSLYFKSAGPKVSPEAVLTYPIRDLQGDVVEPGGIDWTEFNTLNGRLVNVEHGPYIGRAEVEYKSLPILDANKQPDERLGMIRLPVGVTTFFKSSADAGRDAELLRKYDGRGRVVGLYSPDECAEYAEQTYPLVMDGTLSGTSLEFRPNGPEGVAFKSLGKSPMLDRDAYHFYRTDAIGFAAACYLPVNPVAGYSVSDPATIARAEKALRLCEKPATLDVIRKSLRPLTQLLKPPSGRVTAPVRREPQMSTATRRLKKAEEMYDDEPLMEAGPGEVVEDVAAVEPDGDEMAPMGDDMPATAAAAMQGAQGASDLCSMIRDMAKKGEHVKGRKKLSAICDTLDKIAAEYQSVADMVLADVGDGEEMAETDADPLPVETDDDGMIQAKSLSATRWRPLRAAFVTPVVFKKAAPWTPEQLKTAKKARPVNKDETEKLLEWAMNRIDELEAKRA